MVSSIEDIVCGDVALFLSFNGALFLLSVLIALARNVLPRERFASQITALLNNNPLAFISPEIEKFRHSFQIKLPRCGVVMPVKGVHDQSYENWRAQITSMYGGPLDFYFCVESEDDPAYPHIQRLIQESPDCTIHLLVAGVSWHCSQKIHNQMHGFERAMRTCDYVIVLDDDIKLHPGTIRAWVEELETDPQALAASGYAFEYVKEGETSMCAYFAMLWRMMASNGFEHPHNRPPNVWGGAMMLRAEEMRRNVYGITDAWRDGGYSEDFITLSMARYHRRTLAVPKTALFPNAIGAVAFDRFWNFVCRQVFVLTQTHALPAQRFMAMGAALFNALCHASIFLGCITSAAISCYVAAAYLTRAAPAAAAAAAAAGPYAVLGVEGTCASSLAVPSAGAFWLFLALFGPMAKRVLTSFSGLCNVLSPHGYGNEPIDVSHISMWRLSLSYMLYCPIVPAATIVTLLQKSIVWANVDFVIDGGRVSAMRRRDGKGGKPVGEWYSVPREVSLEKMMRELGEYRAQADGLR